MSGLEAAAISVGARMAPYAAGHATRLFGRKRVEAVAESLAAATPHDDYVQTLDPKQLKWLSTFIGSPEFANFVLHAMIFHVAGKMEKPQGPLREEVAQYIRTAGSRIFKQDERTQATDYVLTLIRYAVATSGVRTGTTHPTHIDIAARTSAAAVRNGEATGDLRSLAKIQKFATLLREQVRQTHRKLRLPSVVANVSTDWSQLYVAPDLTPVVRRTLTTGSAEDVRPDLPWDDLFQSQSADESITSDEEPLRYVVTGDPGAGKSTYAAKLAYDMCEPSAGDEGGRAPIPVLITLRDFATEIVHAKSDLLGIIDTVCRNPYSSIPPEGAIDWLLLNGRLALIVDGIDELGAERNRNAFARMLENFAQAYPTCTVVATARTIGYDQAPLDPGWFPERHLRPFSSEQTQEYVVRWFALADQPTSYASGFLRQAEGLPELCENPLLLSLLCALYSTEYTIPRRRPEVYSRCAEVLFERWDRERGLDFFPELHAFTTRVVQELAWRMLHGDSRNSGATWSDLVRALADEVLVDRFASREEAEQAARSFLDFCAGRAWILVEVGTDALEPRYGFVHRTFLEYFAASRLMRHSPTPGKLWRSIRHHLTDASWQMVAVLAIQMFDRYREDGANDVIRLALTPRKSDTKQVRLMQLRFVAELLQSIPMANGTIEYVVKASVSELSADQPWARERADPAESDHFLALLDVELPENVRRISKAIAAALNARETTTFPSPADYIAMAVVRRGHDHARDRVSPYAAEIILSDHDKAVQLERLWHAWSQPTADDLQYVSTDRLFTTVDVLGVTGYPACFDLIRSVLRVEGRRDESLLALRGLLSVLVDRDRFQPYGFATSRFAELLAVGFDKEWLRGMDALSRSAVVLLLARIFYNHDPASSSFDLCRGDAILTGMRAISAGELNGEEARRMAGNWDLEDAAVEWLVLRAEDAARLAAGDALK